MTKAKDLHLSDHFHRLKRTAVLGCASVVVTFLPQLTLVASGPLSPLAGVDPALIRWMLYIVASYYVTGFFLEFRQEERAHAGALTTRALRSLQETADRLREEVDHRRHEMSNCRLTFENLTKMVDGEPHSGMRAARQSDLRNVILEAFNHRRDSTPTDRAMELLSGEEPKAENLEEALQRAIERIESPNLFDTTWPSFSNVVRHDVDQVRHTIERMAVTLDEALISMRRSSKELRTLRVETALISRAYLYGWELGGVVLLWLFATFLLLRHTDHGQAMILLMEMVLGPVAT